MRRVQIPAEALKGRTGQWVELRELTELTMRHKRILRSASMAAEQALKKTMASLKGRDVPDDPKERAAFLKTVDTDSLQLTYDEADSLQQLQAATIVGLLGEWSLGIPLPDMNTIWDLGDELFDFLSNEIGSIGSTDVDFAPNPHMEDDANPTGRPNDSGGHSSDEDVDPSTRPSLSVTTSSASAG